MKKTKYTKPVIQVVRLQPANQMLTLSQGGPVQSVSNSEGFRFDNNGLEEGEELR